MNEKLKILIGVLILPFVVLVYFLDRIICVPLFWLDIQKFKMWSNKDYLVLHSVIRVIAVTIIYSIYKLIQWTF